MIAMEVNGDVAAACSRRPPRRARVGLVLAFAVAPALEVLENSRKLRATKSFKILKIPRADSAISDLRYVDISRTATYRC